MPKKIFVNLPVKDVARSKEFFTKLGYTINPKFSDDKALCVVISENIFAMMLREDYFKTFTKKDLGNAKKTTEVLIALDADSKDEVINIVKKAKDLGGGIYAEPQDHGWMYQHSFEDLDGHQWEHIYMDQSKLPNV